MSVDSDAFAQDKARLWTAKERRDIQIEGLLMMNNVFNFVLRSRLMMWVDKGTGKVCFIAVKNRKFFRINE